MGLLCFVVSAFVLFLNYTSCNSLESCPTQGKVQPCVCFDKETGPGVVCSNVKSIDNLGNALEEYQKCNIYSFTLQFSSFEYLPHDLFQASSIKHMIISSTNFSRIGNLGEPQFKGLEKSLETLKLDKAFSKEHPLPFLLLNHLTRLTTLDIRNSYVGVLHNLWLKEGPKSLEVVRFTNDNLKRVGYKALKSLTNLRVIDLSDNELNYVPRSALPEPAVYLTEINLERNKLEALPEDFFTEMPNLARVNLELNELSTIDERTWKNAWEHLDYINIDYNPMICDHKLKWILEETRVKEKTLVGICYKPFNLMDRDIHSLKPSELKEKKKIDIEL